jgi:hypothetical protein
MLRRDSGEATPRRVAPENFWFLTSFSAQKQGFPYENDVSMCINPVGHDAPIQQSGGGTTWCSIRTPGAHRKLDWTCKPTFRPSKSIVSAQDSALGTGDLCFWRVKALTCWGLLWCVPGCCEYLAPFAHIPIGWVAVLLLRKPQLSQVPWHVFMAALIACFSCLVLSS